MEGGKGLAAARDGDLVTLAHLVGCIHGKLVPFATCTFAPVLINDWKGSLPKDICESRIKSLLPKWKPTTTTTHEIDAVGIGLYCKGLFE